MRSISSPGFLPVLPATVAYRRIGWLFTIAWGAFIIFRRLLREGMWSDGLIYASIARNMAIGKGSFWSPVFAHSFYLPYNQTEVFYEHPPLQFYLQSWFFRFLGDSYATERIYCFVVILLIITLMVQLWWRMVPADHPLHRFEWLPVLILFTCRLTEWTYAQNYLDATMSLFCLLTVNYTIAGWQTPKRSLLKASGAVLALFAAFLTKGPVALHVLAVPGLLGLAYYWPVKIGPAFRWTFLLVGGFGLLLTLVLLYDPARLFLQSYFNQQVLAALSNKREVIPTTAGFFGRAFILKIVVINSAPALVLMGILWVLNRFGFKTKASVSPLSGMIRFYAALCLTSTLPIMATTKQFDYYVVPALPYLSLGLAAWIGPQLLTAIQAMKLSLRRLRVIRTVGGLACVTTVLYGIAIAGTPYHSYRAILSDVTKIGSIVSPGLQLGVCPEIMADPLLHGYMQRYHQLELTTLNTKPVFFLTNERCEPSRQLAQSGYQPMAVPLKRYSLYRRSTPVSPTKRQ
ncbi:ArnT family glycosyltransferase [Larkinella rosea]|uniref:Glycosyltransferase RgtA/B/C/D-like domain-containing protein n=1 Tax=Larkinella rosea TaxID=2025312 RepID=A0A3P1BCI4_9BACT|nr:hypothetical protein [Larkinella rosea]RRA98817.1 hypothetical protein EHT25_27895 [Larkinella rosea]